MPLGLSGSGLITGFDPTASGFGKVLQVVRATDSTDRTTTSTSFVDTGLSVTISPIKSSSKILVISLGFGQITANSTIQRFAMQITDNSNNALSGAQNLVQGSQATQLSIQVGFTLIGYSEPATVAATTYKTRFRTEVGGTAYLQNATHTHQMYAIEVAA